MSHGFGCSCWSPTRLFELNFASLLSCLYLLWYMLIWHSFLSSLPLGLGHLISCILINGAQYFKRISESGIKKMCRNIFVLQQNLTNITMSREADLDFARSESFSQNEFLSVGLSCSKVSGLDVLELLSLSRLSWSFFIRFIHFSWVLLLS